MPGQLSSLSAVLVAVSMAACGGSPTGPGGTPTPTPAGETHPITVLLFEDYDRNGLQGSMERALAGIEVQIGGSRGITDANGRAVVPAVPKGSFPVSVTLATAAPFLTVPREVSAVSPQAADTVVPLIYPIGENNPNLYLAFGDSISSGDLSRDDLGYRASLGRKLTSFYGRPIGVDYRGGSGGRSDAAADRVEGDLKQVRPAFLLIFWGVNDWAMACEPSRCSTISNLRHMIRTARGLNSLPVLATLTPTYSGRDARVPPERNDWVRAMNVLIRSLATEERALLVDLEAAFDREGGYTRLLGDHIHPNDTGYEVIAQAFFDALTRPRGTSTASTFPLLFDPF